MLKLHSLSGAPPIELPYHPDMPLWQYLRDIIALTAGFALVNGKTVEERVLAKGVVFNFANKHKRLKDLIEDHGTLRYLLPLGPSYGTLHGNACPDGGTADPGDRCPVCLEPTFDFSLDCLHRFHIQCLRQLSRCPVCRCDFTPRDRDYVAHNLAARVP